MNEIFVLKPNTTYDKYATVEADTAGTWTVVFYCSCVEHYPNSSKTTIEMINTQFEGINELEIAWIDTCQCCGCPCDIDIQVGYYAYLSNKFWKIVGTRTYEDCGCVTIKLVLNRLTPRESNKSLIECVSCFDKNDFTCKDDTNELNRKN